MQFNLELQNNNDMFPSEWKDLYGYILFHSDNTLKINKDNVNEIRCIKKILSENNVAYDESILDGISHLEICIFRLKSLMIYKNKIDRENFVKIKKLRNLVRISVNENRKNDFMRDIDYLVLDKLRIKQQYNSYNENLNRIVLNSYSDTEFTGLLKLHKKRLILDDEDINSLI
jgi:hypothetical protein